MTIDMLGNIVKVDEVSTDNLTIKNGTILITNSDVAVDLKKITYKVVLTNDNFILTKNITKWQYIKVCLRLAWERLWSGE